MQPLLSGLPRLYYPLNALPAEKTQFSIRLWQELCVCYSFVEMTKRITSGTTENSKFPTLSACAKYLRGLVRTIAHDLICFYADIIPTGLTVEDLCDRDDLDALHEAEVNEFKFIRIRSLLSSSYGKLWEKVRSTGGTRTVDELLFEFRRRLRNRLRRQKSSTEIDLFWFPSEWLCFLTFGILRESRQLIFSAQLVRECTVTSSSPRSNRLPDSLPADSLSGEGLRGFLLDDLPAVNYLYNSLPRSLTRKTHQMWQQLCIGYAMIEYRRCQQQASLVRSVEKEDVLLKAYHHFARKIVARYADDMPTGLTAQLLCQWRLDEGGGQSRAIDGYSIQRAWTALVSQLSRTAMVAWQQEIVPVYGPEDFKDRTALPLILSTLRRTWWTLDQLKPTETQTRPRQQFDGDWFPSQWLVFLCFGPLSRLSFFSSSSRAARPRTVPIAPPGDGEADRLTRLIAEQFPSPATSPPLSEADESTSRKREHPCSSGNSDDEQTNRGDSLQWTSEDNSRPSPRKRRKIPLDQPHPLAVEGSRRPSCTSLLQLLADIARLERELLDERKSLEAEEKNLLGRFAEIDQSSLVGFPCWAGDLSLPLPLPLPRLLDWVESLEETPL